MIARLQGLPMFWRVLLPFLAILVALGIIGGFLVVGSARVQAESDLDAALSDAFLTARGRFNERELSVLESANFAANIQGMAQATTTPDPVAAERLLRSVLALKPEIGLLVATDLRGVGVAELRTTGSDVVMSSGSDWTRSDVVIRALDPVAAERRSGLLDVDGRIFLAVISPICAGEDACQPTGAAIAGIDTTTIVGQLLGPSAGLGLFDEAGTKIAAVGTMPETIGDVDPDGTLARRSVDVDGTSLALAVGSVRLQEQVVATLAVAIDQEPQLAALRRTAVRLGVLLALGMVAVVAIGALLARSIVGELRTLMETNRRLAAGDLGARAPVGPGGEVAELAEGMNRMAEQLEMSVERLEARVAERTEEIQRLLDARSEFFAGLSHELRTPLAAIMAQADILRESGADEDDVAATLSALGGQLLSTVNSILHLARAEAGTIDDDVSAQTVDVAPVLGDLRATLGALAASAGLELSVEAPEEPVLVHGDPRMAQAVVTALVENAVKYTPAGGVVGVHTEQHNGYVEVVVQDTGVGIPADVGDRIFEPFVRVPGSETQAGQPSSGLGLAVAKRFADAQGGSLEYESDDTGTTFVFRLRRAEI